MKNYTITIITILIFTMTGNAQNFSLAIHGGAGRLLDKNFSDSRKAKYKKALDSALTIGYNILADSGTSIEACEAAVSFLEDCPLFNAGKGAVFNAEGSHEMDAAIMNGANLNAGSVTGICSAKNPIQVARTIMDSSSHVMLSGLGAEEFIRKQEIPIADSGYFDVARRKKQLEKAKAKSVIMLDHDRTEITPNDEEYKYGTVGAVAMDIHGDLAAATSTGGMTNKEYGRIGDSPVIGAGTYANNLTCAVSCTGHGEYFMRTLAAYDVHALMYYGGLTVDRASAYVIEKKIAALEGQGGMIVVDKNGTIVFAFNTDGMYRGSITQDGIKEIKIFKVQSDLENLKVNVKVE